MAKTTRKQKILIIISLIIIAAICAAFVNFYKEKNYWQEDAARYNRYHWEELNLMASTAENTGFTKEGISEIYLYINAKVFPALRGFIPRLTGTGHTQDFGYLLCFFSARYNVKSQFER